MLFELIDKLSRCPCFTVAIPILLYYLIGVPFERGFNCDDDSLQYPYKDSTISSLALYLVGTILPVSSVSFTSTYDGNFSD